MFKGFNGDIICYLHYSTRFYSTYLCLQWDKNWGHLPKNRTDASMPSGPGVSFMPFTTHCRSTCVSLPRYASSNFEYLLLGYSWQHSTIPKREWAPMLLFSNFIFDSSTKDAKIQLCIEHFLGQPLACSEFFYILYPIIRQVWSKQSSHFHCVSKRPQKTQLPINAVQNWCTIHVHYVNQNVLIGTCFLGTK